MYTAWLTRLTKDRGVYINAGSSSFTRSVFDALKAPALRDLTWKRSVHCNLQPKGKHRARGKGSSGPKNFIALQRVKEFPEECLEVIGAGKSKLFSTASERVFSLLTNSFGERRNSSLQDYIEASIMMQNNNR